MTWALAKEQVIDMIEEIAESSLSPHYRERFEHDPTGHAASAPGQTRRFSVWGTGARSISWATGASSRRTLSDTEIGVDYMYTTDSNDLDTAIWTDYEIIRTTLLDVPLWESSTSTIEGVTQAETGLESEVIDLENNDGEIAGRRLFIRFAILHRAL